DRDWGVWSTRGKVAAVLDDSDTAKAKKGAQPGDLLKQLVLRNAKTKHAVRFANEPGLPGPDLAGWTVEEKPLDPLRLPDQAARWADSHGTGGPFRLTAGMAVERAGAGKDDPPRADPQPT